MNCDGDIGKTYGRFDEFFKINRIGILPCSFGNLKHHGCLFLFASLHNCLKKFHVVDIEGAERVFAFERLGKQLSRVCQWHSSVFDSVGTNRLPGQRDRIV